MYRHIHSQLLPADYLTGTHNMTVWAQYNFLDIHVLHIKKLSATLHQKLGKTDVEVEGCYCLQPKQLGPHVTAAWTTNSGCDPKVTPK